MEAWRARELREERLKREARAAHGSKVATTAGYALFGSAFFEPFINGEPLTALNYALMICGSVVLSLTVWYAPWKQQD